MSCIAMDHLDRLAVYAAVVHCSEKTRFTPTRTELVQAPKPLLFTRCNSLRLPPGNFGFDPADGTAAKRHRFWKLAAGHFFVDRRSAKPSHALDFGAPQKALQRWLRCLSFHFHIRRSLNFRQSGRNSADASGKSAGQSTEIKCAI